MDRLIYRAPFEHQSRLLRSQRYRALIVAGRQSGKTEGMAMAIVDRAHAKVGWYRWIGPTYKQVNVAILTLKRILADYPGWYFRTGAKTFYLSNGSMIEVMAAGGEASLQGPTLAGVVLDEVADLKATHWYEDLEPTLLVSKGWAILGGKPRGFNWVEELYPEIKDNPAWEVLNFPSWLSPLVDKADIDALKSIIGTHAWRQEYGGEFVAGDLSMWPPEFFDDVLVPTIPTDFQRCCISIDLSEGNIKSDYQGLVVLGMRDKMQYLHCENLRVPATSLLNRVKELCEIYKPVEKLVVDMSGCHLFTADAFNELWPHGIGRPKVVGIKQHVRKETRIQRLASLLNNKLVKVLDNEGGREYVREGRDFPCSDFDDMLDAHEMAVAGMHAN